MYRNFCQLKCVRRCFDNTIRQNTCADGKDKYFIKTHQFSRLKITEILMTRHASRRSRAKTRSVLMTHGASFEIYLAECLIKFPPQSLVVKLNARNNQSPSSLKTLFNDFTYGRKVAESSLKREVTNKNKTKSPSM